MFFILDHKPAWLPADLKAIVIRPPQWSAKEPHQDLPIYAFTLQQWAAHEDRGEFPLDAGGYDWELYRNAHYVFAVHNRDLIPDFNPSFSPEIIRGAGEVERILKNLEGQHPEAASRRHP